MEKLIAIIEGYLFISGDNGVDIDDFKVILDIDDENEIISLLEKLSNKYRTDESSGLMLQKFAKTRYRMVAKDKFFDYYLKLENIKTETKLSSAAIEVLCLIAYRGPISKPEVEQIRGVNCENIFLKLRTRNLIKEVGKSDGVGRPMLYATTNEFLKYFNLNSLDDLPPIQESEDSKDLF